MDAFGLRPDVAFGVKMRPRHVISARALLPQNQTLRPRRKGLDLTAWITEGIEAEGRDALPPGSRVPDPRCGRACPGLLKLDDDTLNGPGRAERHLVAGGRQFWVPTFR
jgi:hypothetical protein